jgi:hypothetical protein
MFVSFQTEAAVQTLRQGRWLATLYINVHFIIYINSALSNPEKVHTGIGLADRSLSRVQKNEAKQRQDGHVELTGKALARILFQRKRKRSIWKGSLVNVILEDERSFQTLPKRRRALSAGSRWFYSLP